MCGLAQRSGMAYRRDEERQVLDFVVVEPQGVQVGQVGKRHVRCNLILVHNKDLARKSQPPRVGEKTSVSSVQEAAE